MTESIRARYENAHDEGRPLLGGHRGNPAQHPENTMRSFRSAIEAGCDLIECDVHLTSDGRLVVIHDHTLERTTNGHGFIRDHTAAQLRKLDAGEGEHIPLLHDVIELALGKVGLVIEIKQLPITYDGLEEKLVNMLRQLGAVQECAVVSFHHPAIRKLREMEPRLQLGILEGALAALGRDGPRAGGAGALRGRRGGHVDRGRRCGSRLVQVLQAGFDLHEPSVRGATGAQVLAALHPRGAARCLN